VQADDTVGLLPEVADLGDRPSGKYCAFDMRAQLRALFGMNLARAAEAATSYRRPALAVAEMLLAKGRINSAWWPASGDKRLLSASPSNQWAVHRAVSPATDISGHGILARVNTARRVNSASR
jgi:hypothetical protein